MIPMDDDRNVLLFKINADEVLMVAAEPDNNTLGIDDTTASWFYKNNAGTIYQIVDPYWSWLSDTLEHFKMRIQAALKGDLEIDRKRFTNIGYTWNQELYSVEKKTTSWIGECYLCFSTAQGPETFIYSDNGIIYIEIIPTYPWLFGKRPLGIRKVTFSQFLKNYKPLVQTILPREQATVWLTQIDSVLKSL